MIRYALVILFCIINTLTAQSRHQDSLALVAIYNATDGPDWVNKTNWLSSQPISLWYGVVAFSGRVDWLLLPSNNLKNSLPNDISNLDNLQLLLLNDNQMTSIPKSIGSLKRLKAISFGRNNLYSIPTEIGGLDSLQAMDLSENNLQRLPAGIGNLSSIQSLAINKNKLSGLPKELGNLNTLQWLSISNNNLISLPQEMGNLSQLRVLNAHSNRLYYLPNLQSLNKLDTLRLDSNRLQFGEIEPYAGINYFTYRSQENIGKEKSIYIKTKEVLHIGNYVSGKNNVYQWYKDSLVIDGANENYYKVSSAKESDSGSYFCKITNTVMTELTLASNKIKVFVNPDKRRDDSLALVAIYNATDGPNWRKDDNWLSTGPMHTWFGVTVNHNRVTRLNLYSNSLKGPLPGEIGDLDQLTHLSLQGNPIKQVPVEIGMLGSLVFLDLDNCEIEGLPREIGNLIELRTLELTRNKLKTIPAEIGELKNLPDLNLSFNKLNKLPPEIGMLKQLKGLGVSYNRLDSLPIEIENLTKLESLGLGNNKLNNLDFNLKNLTELRTLSLWGNNFKKLPAELLDLSKLEILSVSYNKLDFAEIEKYLSIKKYYYSPQDTIGENLLLKRNVGDSLSIAFDIGGIGNRYQWYKDGISIEGSNSPVLNIASLNTRDEAIYNCEVTNSKITDLTLYSGLYDLRIDRARQMDSLTLVAIYNSTNGSEWYNKRYWLSSKPINEWEGVTVRQERVVKLNLSYKNIKGELPKDLGYLTKVESVNLEKNSITKLPDEIAFLLKLHSLDLRANDLDSLPPAIGNLINLNYLYLDDNKLTVIPKEISNLSKLISLELNNNLLTDLPDEIWGLETLVSLGLSDNHLSKIPKELGNLKNLEGLALSENDLTTLPISIGSLTELKYLSLGDNKLTLLPKEIGNLKKLAGLYLDKNKLKALPNELGNLSKLAFLDLAANEFSNLPTCIETIPTLKELNISENKLDSLSKTLGKLVNLKNLNLSMNQLKTIPPDLGNLSKLEYLYLNNNQLDSLSKTLGKLVNLKNLNLSMNQLKTIPSDLGNLPKLEYLYLNDNQLTGLPVEIKYLPELKRLQVKKNKLNFTDLKEFLYSGFTYLYHPQDSLSNDTTLYSKTGATFKLSVDLEGDGNRYQWFKDMRKIDYSDSSVFQLDSLSSYDLGTYHCEIKNDDVPSLTLYTGLYELRVDSIKNGRYADSLALVEIYKSTNGSNWENKKNWLTSKSLEDWHGIKIDRNRVSEINLRANRLKGRIANELGDLYFLEKLNLSSNEIDSIPETIDSLNELREVNLYRNKLKSISPKFTKLRKLQKLDLSYNYLHFEDLEPLISIEKLLYKGQFFSSEQYDVHKFVGDSAVFISSFRGEYTTYQWYKNGQKLTGRTSKKLILYDLKYDFGSNYICEVKNTVLPGLTRKTRVHLTVSRRPHKIRSFLTVLQNPLLNRFTNFLLTIDSTIIRKPTLTVNNDTVKLSRVNERLYSASYDFTKNGKYTFSSHVESPNGSVHDTSRVFQVTKIQATKLSFIYDLNNKKRAEIPPATYSGNINILYEYNRKEKEHMFYPKHDLEKTIKLSLPISNHSKLAQTFIYFKNKDNEWTRLPSQVFKNEEIVVAYVDKLGTYKLDIDENFQGSNIVPDRYRLSQNYPNPFNPYTTIQYDLADDSHVKISIYNSLGQKIKEFLPGFQRAKSAYKIQWNGQNERGVRVSSGIYFYSIETNKFRDVKKMVLLK